MTAMPNVQLRDDASADCAHDADVSARLRTLEINDRLIEAGARAPGSKALGMLPKGPLSLGGECASTEYTMYNSKFCETTVNALENDVQAFTTTDTLDVNSTMVSDDTKAKRDGNLEAVGDSLERCGNHTAALGSSDQSTNTGTTTESLKGGLIQRRILLRYPPDELLKDSSSWAVHRCEPRKSKACGSMGLHAASVIQRGELIGIYGGEEALMGGAYVMEVKKGLLVNCTPVHADPCTWLGYINDHIWGPQGQNAKLESNGYIRASKRIAVGEEIFMSYGEDYDWDELKGELLGKVLSALQLIGPPLGVPVVPLETEIAQLREHGFSLPMWRQGSGTRRVLAAFIDGVYEEQGAIHSGHVTYSPGRGISGWIEEIAKCVTFHEQLGFGKQNPAPNSNQS
jgi:hypothetical protein